MNKIREKILESLQELQDSEQSEQDRVACRCLMSLLSNESSSAALPVDADELRSQLDVSRIDRKNLQKKYKKLEDQMDTVIQARDQLKKQVDTLYNECQQRSRAQKVAEDWENYWEGTAQERAKRVEDQKAEIDRLNQQGKLSDEEARALRVKLVKCRTHMKNVIRERNKWEKMAKEYDGSRQQKELEIQKLRSQASDSEQKVASLENEKRQLKVSLDAECTKSAQTQQTAQSHADTIAQQEADIRQYTSEAESSHQEMERLNQEITQLKEDIAAARGESTQNQQTAQDRFTQMSQKDEEIQALCSEKKELENSLGDYRHHHQALLGICSDLLSSVGETCQDILLGQGEHEAWRAMYASVCFWNGLLSMPRDPDQEQLEYTAIQSIGRFFFEWASAKALGAGDAHAMAKCMMEKINAILSEKGYPYIVVLPMLGVAFEYSDMLISNKGNSAGRIVKGIDTWGIREAHSDYYLRKISVILR